MGRRGVKVNQIISRTIGESITLCTELASSPIKKKSRQLHIIQRSDNSILEFQSHNFWQWWGKIYVGGVGVGGLPSLPASHLTMLSPCEPCQPPCLPSSWSETSAWPVPDTGRGTTNRFMLWLYLCFMLWTYLLFCRGSTSTCSKSWSRSEKYSTAAPRLQLRNPSEHTRSNKRKPKIDSWY